MEKDQVAQIDTKKIVSESDEENLQDCPAPVAGEGNTDSPPAKAPKKTKQRCRRFCFTINNWTTHDYKTFLYYFEDRKAYYIVGSEGSQEDKTMHLQGYVEFKSPTAFSTLKKHMPRAHIEKARGNREQNKTYCSKEGEVLLNTFPPTMRELCMEVYKDVVWKPWQQKVIDIIQTKPDSRTVYWFWEENGNVGKSFLNKFLFLEYNVILGGGKAADTFNQIKNWFDAHPHDPITAMILDIPRCSLQYISYQAIENIKNGLVVSGKYEGGMFAFPYPHVICFANEPPNEASLSSDRWKVIKIEN